MADTIGRKIVTTKKQHICFGCGRKFPKGTKMERSCIVDGTAWTCYLCPTCIEITSLMHLGDDFGYGELREEALEREKRGHNNERT